MGKPSRRESSGPPGDNSPDGLVVFEGANGVLSGGLVGGLTGAFVSWLTKRFIQAGGRDTRASRRSR